MFLRNSRVKSFKGILYDNFKKNKKVFLMYRFGKIFKIYY